MRHCSALSPPGGQTDAAGLKPAPCLWRRNRIRPTASWAEGSKSTRLQPRAVRACSRVTVTRPGVTTAEHMLGRPVSHPRGLLRRFGGQWTRCRGLSGGGALLTSVSAAAARTHGRGKMCRAGLSCVRPDHQDKRRSHEAGHAPSGNHLTPSCVMSARGSHRVTEERYLLCSCLSLDALPSTSLRD